MSKFITHIEYKTSVQIQLLFLDDLCFFKAIW